MADINITGTGNFAANSYNVPNPVAGQTQVSFHSANGTCLVCFSNSATFGMGSYTVSPGPKQDLTLAAVEPTEFTCNSGPSCPPSKSPKAGPNYNITMGGGLGGKHHGKS